MEPSHNGHSPVILVADDNRITRTALCGMVRKEGYQPLEAVDGVQALHHARTHLPDLILLDLRMPRLDGYEVCQALRESEETQLIPIVIVTAASDLESRLRSYDLDADDFLAKPVQRVELLARIRSLMRLRRLINEKLREKELRARLEQELAISRLRKEEEQRRLYQDVLFALTGGKLRMLTAEEMRVKLAPLRPVKALTLNGPQSVGEARHLVLDYALRQGMNEERTDNLVVCVSEAATNVIKHAGSGRLEVAREGDSVLVHFADKGPGFQLDQLARCTLMKGFSTSVSLGMGFTIMLEFLDEIYLQSDGAGTQLILCHNLHPVQESLDSLLAAFPSLY
ncbi:MAG: response regulator [Armatimonadetes bacterium]|nr:response regulator [Armatimonadota bacterium]